MNFLVTIAVIGAFVIGEYMESAIVVFLFNINFAIAVKVAFLMIAGLGIATLWMAVIADVGISILVIFNGLRALKINNIKY